MAGRVETLQRRLDCLLGRIEALERRVDCIKERKVSKSDALMMPSENRFSNRRRNNALVDDPHGTVSKLSTELDARGVQDVAFVRAPAEYYEKDLEFRREVLDAPSVHHLCKSIIMENTRCPPSNSSCMENEEGIVKYWLVIVQYSSRLDSEILRTCVYDYHKGLLSRGKINMRLVAEEKSHELSGFRKNAVTPIGMKTRLPIVLAKEIADLDPDEFWIGGGEVDLKIGMRVSDFIKAYDPIVVPLGEKRDSS